jgi:hypothetical protein
MHSEHLTNLHWGWVVGGWLVAVAVTSGVYLALVGTGFFPEGAAAVFGIAVAMAAGFFAGGLFVGYRWIEAPILHGVAMTFVSVVVLLQLAASVGGGWVGRRATVGPEEVQKPEGVDAA